MADTTVATDAADICETDEGLEIMRQALAALHIWRLALPVDVDELDAKGTSTPQLALGIIAERLEALVQGQESETKYADHLPLMQAVSLLETVEAALWKVSVLELRAIRVDWCAGAVLMAAEIIEEMLRGEVAVGEGEADLESHAEVHHGC